MANAASNTHSNAVADARVAGDKVSPVLGALQKVHIAHDRGHAALDRLVEALAVVLSSAPPTDGGRAEPDELISSALHGELLTARASALGFEARVDALIDRLTL